MSEPIIYIDRSRIRPGKLEQVKKRIAELVDFIDEREPQLLFYGFYVDEGSARMTVVAVHPDAASVELHMDVGALAFRRFADLIEMDGIEVYGEASDRMFEQLQQKARDLGEDGSVRIDQLNAGFSRIADAAAQPHH
jgi:quinol monooxygenase YgiN